jgi:hypothetical protein
VVTASPPLYGQALQTLVTAGRGRFWLKPSALAELLDPLPNPHPPAGEG